MIWSDNLRLYRVETIWVLSLHFYRKYNNEADKCNVWGRTSADWQLKDCSCPKAARHETNPRSKAVISPSDGCVCFVVFAFHFIVLQHWPSFAGLAHLFHPPHRTRPTSLKIGLYLIKFLRALCTSQHFPTMGIYVQSPTPLFLFRGSCVLMKCDGQKSHWVYLWSFDS